MPGASPSWSRLRGSSSLIAAVRAPLAGCSQCHAHLGGVDRGHDRRPGCSRIAARVGALALPREILVSGMVKDLVAGSGIEFDTEANTTSKEYLGPGSCSLLSFDLQRR